MSKHRGDMTARAPKVVMTPAVQAPLPETAQFEKRKKYSVWFLPSVYKSVQHEAIDREMSVGDVFEEAVRARLILIDHAKESK